MQKKIIAYENDTSEETKAQIQKLKVDLEKSERDLQDMEYDRMVSDQKKMLDNLYDDFETVLNRRLDNIDDIMSGSRTHLANINSLLSGISEYFTADKSILYGTVPHYASGGLNTHTGLAWLDGTKSDPEIVLSPSDSKNFIALKDMLQKLASKNVSLASEAYSNFAQMPHSSLQLGLSDMISKLSTKTSGGVTQNFNVSIPIERVEDYNDFVAQLQKDKKFEKMIRAMTIEPAFGGTTLSKNKYVWK